MQVGVSDNKGQPISGAYVWADGLNDRTTTDATGNATVSGLKPGVYQVETGLDGYFRQHATVSVGQSGNPAPVAVTLPYAPPTSGTFVYQPKSTEWEVLGINSADPWDATLTVNEWGCFTGSWSHQVERVGTDTSQDVLTIAQGGTIPIVGPSQLPDGWKQNGSVPDTNYQPPQGTCNGSSAAWDNSGA